MELHFGYLGYKNESQPIHVGDTAVFVRKQTSTHPIPPWEYVVAYISNGKPFSRDGQDVRFTALDACTAFLDAAIALGDVPYGQWGEASPLAETTASQENKS